MPWGPSPPLQPSPGGRGNLRGAAIMADTSMWPDEIYRILRDWDVTQFSYVPDAGHAVLINRSLEDPDVHSVGLTTEEEGVAMLAGAHLRGGGGGGALAV